MTEPNPSPPSPKDPQAFATRSSDSPNAHIAGRDGEAWSGSVRWLHLMFRACCDQLFGVKTMGSCLVE